MSELERLIEELCPNGVEFKFIWELTAWDKKFNSVEKEKQKKIIKYNYFLAADLKSYEKENGTIKILTTNVTDLWADENDVQEVLSEGEIVCIPGGGNPIVQYYNGKFITGDNRIATSLNTSILNNKYLYYCMQNQIKEIASFYRGSGIKHPDMSKVLDMRVPVPPLEVQQEIVRILDSFTELTAELTAELEARKKQYEYYRDNLFDLGDNVPRVRLGDIATIIRGGNFQKKDFTEEGKPCIHYGQMYTHFGIYAEETLKFVSEEVFNNSKQAVSGDIVMAVTSENVDDVCSCTAWLGRDPIAISGHTAIIHHNQNAKYLSYYFHTSYFFKQKVKLAHGTKVIEVTPSKLGDIIIPLPSMQEQQRIVDILDSFDALCNDISTGLPAEIEARQKQYEYYRDKLLTFKEKSV